MTPPLRRRAGFTLIEILVVLAIIGLIAGLVGPRVMNALSGARTDSAELQIKNIEAAADMFKIDTGRYPNAAEGLNALVTRPSGLAGWNGPYLKETTVPKDPWGNDYIYEIPSRHGGSFDLYSLGADKAPGGEGENADVRNWKE
ncbi:MAG: type II secretion system major pseudopilin GspG [Azoarcus sp.]|jgi:general secretion pathway protein G|nr:type II secretion system major pseudopilin GspG [Azoarcus sp.]